MKEFFNIKLWDKKKWFFAVFFLMLFLSFVSMIISIFVSDGSVFENFFFHSGEDRFMDFFNSIRDAKDQDVYTVQKVIYPPLVNIFYFFCSKCINPSLVKTDFDNRMLMQTSAIANVIVIIFYAFILIALYKLIDKKLKTNEIIKHFFFFTCALSFPFLYAMERGNIILLCMIFVLIFILFIDSEKKWQQEIALIALGLAISIKLYPVLFSILLIVKKDYRKFVKLAIYSFAFTILPFIFYDGISGIITYAKNVLTFSNKRGGSLSLVNTNFKGFLLLIGVIDKQATILVTLLVLMFLTVGAFLFEPKWQKTLCIILMMNCFNGNSSLYSLSFMIIPLFLLFNEEKVDYKSYVYLILLLLLILPNGIYFTSINGVSQLIYKLMIFPIIFIMYCLIIFETTKIILKSYHIGYGVSYASAILVLAIVVSFLYYDSYKKNETYSIDLLTVQSNSTGLVVVADNSNIKVTGGVSTGWDIWLKHDDGPFVLEAGQYMIKNPKNFKIYLSPTKEEEFDSSSEKDLLWGCFEIEEDTTIYRIRIQINDVDEVYDDMTFKVSYIKFAD